MPMVRFMSIRPQNSVLPMLVLTAVLLAACKDSSAPSALPVPVAPVRDASPAQLSLGEKVYQQNCSRCHGVTAEGNANWRKRDTDGKFPPPPLNGSGHAWHHPVEVLKAVIKDGSPDGQGNMPAWRDKLSEQEIDAVILWFQSLWPQPVYDAWFEMQQRGR